jgi:phage tail-like protein
MDDDRGSSQLVQPEQWARCALTGSSLLPTGGVTLSWTDDTPRRSGRRRDQPAGLTFDRWCRAYRSRPAQGTVEVIPVGEYTSAGHGPGVLRRPLGVAVDKAQRLYIAESGTGVVHVVDLWGQRLLRKVPIRCTGRRRPVDIAAQCCGALVLLQEPAGLVVIEGRRGPKPGPDLVPPPCAQTLRPSRIAVSSKGPLVLWRHPRAARAIVSTVDGTVVVEVPGATDLDTAPDGTLVVARQPGQSFRRFAPNGLELEPVGALDYDGGAMAVAPNGRIAFTTAEGLAWTSGATAVHQTSGTVVSYRFDSGTYRTRWGRLFLDGCLPPSTDVQVQFATSDDDAAVDPPPLLLSQPTSLFRRPTGREAPWAQIAADDDFETYETPVVAEPGRYLWVVFTLSGTHRISPKVRAVRIERPGHHLLRQLPRSWSRADGDAAFLQRFLAPAEGMLRELDQRAAQRAVLVNPSATPREALAWLAGFAGLVLDRRWPEDARRELVAQAYPLFRRRGTKAALITMLGIYLGRPPVIVERWQLRGLGGTVLGTRHDGPQAPAVGAATGALGSFTVGGVKPGQTSYSLSAHRFTVLVPGELSTEQLAVLRGILDDHRPAHTLYDICELGSGMRVGQRLHLRLSSFVGPSAQFGPAVAGNTLVGGDGVIGVPAVGSRLGDQSVAGRVRVG